jgi:hypothetical protein
LIAAIVGLRRCLMTGLADGTRNFFDGIANCVGTAGDGFARSLALRL